VVGSTARDSQVFHWDGRDWTVFPTLDLLAGGPVAVRGRSANEVWVAWIAEVADGSVPQEVLFWDGEDWTHESVDFGWWGNTYPDESIIVTGNGDVWAAHGFGIIARRRDGGWRIDWPGLVPGSPRIHGSGPGDVWIAIENTLLHDRRGSWNGTFLPLGSAQAVWAVSPNEAWVAGDGRVARCDGETCTTMLPSPGGSPYDVWASGSDDVWVVGSDGLVRRWDGVEWQTPASAARGTLWSVTGTGPRDVWIVACGSSPDGVLQFGGSVLADVDGAPSVCPYRDWWHRPDIVAIATDDVWLGGDPGLWHWNGSDWNRVVLPAGAVGVEKIHATSRDDVWVIDREGGLRHWDGATWARALIGDFTRITDVWGSGGDDMWVLSGGARLRRVEPPEGCPWR